MGQTIGLYWHCFFVSFLLGIFLAPHLGQIVKYQAELPGVTSSMSTIRREDLQLPRDSWGRYFLLASYDVLWVGTSLEMGVLKGTLSWKWNAKWKSCWNTSCSVWASIDLSRLWFRSTIGLYENGVLLSTVQCTPESDFAVIFHIQSAILGYGQTHNPEARTALNTRPAWRCGDGGATKGRGQLEGKRSNQLAGVNSCRILSPSCLDVPWCSILFLIFGESPPSMPPIKEKHWNLQELELQQRTTYQQMERLGRRIEVWKPQMSMFDHHRLESHFEIDSISKVFREKPILM